MKRSASSPTARLSSRTSPHHASVTLFELNNRVPDGSSNPTRRRSKRVKLTETNDITDVEDLHASSNPKQAAPLSVERAGSKSPRKAKPIPLSLETPHPAPPRWRETYDTIKEMRSRTTAPVDTMGCDQAQYKETDPKSQRFATLVSLMLSSQTKDEVTDAAVAKLRDALGGSLTVDALLQADDGAISEAIAKVGFWRRKTQYLRQAAQRLRDDFDSDVPKTVDELCSLPGVGPKMAFLALQVAWKINVGIGVDVHVHRITNRLGWHIKPTKTPEQTRLNLQSWLPKELHGEINHLLVGFGQTICLPVGPRCDKCDLSTKNLCPSARKVKPKKTKPVTLASRSSGPQLEIEVEVNEKPHPTEVEEETLSELTDLTQEE